MLGTPTVVFMFGGRGPLISRVFVIILLFCIRASTRQNETTRHFVYYGNIVEKIDLQSYLVSDLGYR